MTPEETYLFDLNGYLILRGVLPPSLVDELNRELDKLEALSDKEIRGIGLTRSLLSRRTGHFDRVPRLFLHPAQIRRSLRAAHRLAHGAALHGGHDLGPDPDRRSPPPVPLPRPGHRLSSRLLGAPLLQRIRLQTGAASNA